MSLLQQRVAGGSVDGVKRLGVVSLERLVVMYGGDLREGGRSGSGSGSGGGSGGLQRMFSGGIVIGIV
jgi:hypothetical protein